MINNRGTFDRQMGLLRDQVVQMCDMVEQSISFSVRALQSQDLVLAQRMDQFDAEINKRRFTVEENAYCLLALQQPNSHDMRSIVGLVSAVTNVERIGDHAAGIARLALRLGTNPAMMPPVMFGAMATTDQWLLRNAITAFVSENEELAQTVIERDAEIDQMHRDVHRQLLGLMTQDAACIEAGTMLLWVSHNLERIGDRAVNIAGRVPFLTKGELVRQPVAHS